MDTDEPIVFKDGYTPTPEQEQAVALANSQLGHKEALGLIESIAKLPDKEKAGQWVWTSGELVQGQENLRATAPKKPTTGLAGGGSGGSSFQEPAGRHGPAVGSVEDGYRYLGGDPSSPSSWEKAE